MNQINEQTLGKLREHALNVRRNIIYSTAAAGGGHPSSSLSATEILVALYFSELRFDPTNPSWPERDRFVLSKGHAAPGLYAVLAEAGYFPQAELLTLRKFGTRLQGHPTPAAPGIEVATGALGQGLSFCVGAALAGRMKGASWRVYTLMGDGELGEGQVWESALTAAKYHLGSLCAICDYNRVTQTGPIDVTKPLDPLAEKWRAFGWHAIEVDGHDFGQICAALAEARTMTDRPTMIVAHTIKGKGISFMEHSVGWHGRAPNAEQAAAALEELR
jgi:transketolase